jgi:hypothetical protein
MERTRESKDSVSLDSVLADPGFENESKGVLDGCSRPWVGEEANEVTIVNDGTAHGGFQHATIVGDYGQLMQMMHVEPNTGYRVHAFLRAAGGDLNQYLSDGKLDGFFVSPAGGPDSEGGLDCDDGFDNPPYLKAVRISAGADWGELSFEFNSGPYSNISVNFDARPGDSVVLSVDDVSVTAESVTPHPRLWGTASDGRVDISWTPYLGAADYVVWRARDTTNNFPSILTRVPASSCSDTVCTFTDTDLINGLQTTYQIAVEEGGQGTESWIFSYDKLVTLPGDGYCGDGACGTGEACYNCALDCGFCADADYCGDGVCNGNETCSPCEADCGACSSDGPSLSLAASSIPPDASFDVVVKGAPGNADDWVGMFPAGASGAGYSTYQYLNGATQTTLTFTAPSTPGAYELRLYANDSETDLRATVAFTVTAP